MRCLFLFISIVCVLGGRVYASTAASGVVVGEQTIWDQIMMGQSYRNMSRGVSYMDSNQYRAAANEFGKAVVENPNDAWPHILLGSSLYWVGQVDQAITEYETALKLDPKNAQAHQLLGIAHAWKGETPDALEHFKTAASLDPSKPDVQMNLGSIYQALGDYQNALTYFRNAVELEPKHPLYHFQLATLYGRLGRDEDAAASYNKAIKIYPDYEDAIIELAALYERMGRDKDALKLFRQAVKIKPGDSVARLRLAMLLLRGGQSREADNVISGAFSLQPQQKGEGIALTMAYAGTPAGGGAGQDGQQGGQSSGGPMDSLRKNLERIPLDQEARVQAEIVYMPKAKIEVVTPDKAESLKNALDQAVNRSRAVGMRREFVLPTAGAAERGENIRALTQELGRSLAEAGGNAQFHMALSIETSKPGSGGGGGGKGSAALGGPNKSSAGSVEYNPRAVGNDMGLWVMGTAWIELVNEVVPQLSGGSASDGARSAAAGLSQVILGQPQAALASFDEAASRGAKEAGYLGAAVAYIELGDEQKALEYCRKALEANPKSSVARQNLKWLNTPSSVSGK